MSQMKTDFRLIKELLGAPGGGSASGFGWDDGTKKVVATEAVWAAKIKVCHHISTLSSVILTLETLGKQ